MNELIRIINNKQTNEDKQTSIKIIDTTTTKFSFKL